MDTESIRTVARAIVTDLVTNQVIAIEQSPNEWRLKATVAGLLANTSYRSRDELIDRVTAAYVNQAQKLRAAS